MQKRLQGRWNFRGPRTPEAFVLFRKANYSRKGNERALPSKECVESINLYLAELDETQSSVCFVLFSELCAIKPILLVAIDLLDSSAEVLIEVGLSEGLGIWQVDVEPRLFPKLHDNAFTCFEIQNMSATCQVFV